MRELKFRIWDNHTKRYVTFVYETNKDCYLFIAPSGYVTAFNCYGEEIDFEDGRFVVQQYTGLKDKNGKDIYEGDIVKLSLLHYEIMNVYGQFIATCPNYCHYNWPKFENFVREARCSEVVGNIFDNPELLK